MFLVGASATSPYRHRQFDSLSRTSLDGFGGGDCGRVLYAWRVSVKQVCYSLLPPAFQLLDGGEGAGRTPKGKPGRPTKAKPDRFDRVIRSMIDSGDVERYGRKWKSELLPRYKEQLPNGMTPGGLRKRVEREEQLRAAYKN